MKKAPGLLLSRAQFRALISSRRLRYVPDIVKLARTKISPGEGEDLKGDEAQLGVGWGAGAVRSIASAGTAGMTG